MIGQGSREGHFMEIPLAFRNLTCAQAQVWQALN